MWDIHKRIKFTNPWFKKISSILYLVILILNFQDINENQPNLSCDMYGVSNSLKWLMATGALLWGMSALDLLFSTSLSCTYISPSAKIFSPIKCCKKRGKECWNSTSWFFKKSIPGNLLLIENDWKRKSKQCLHLSLSHTWKYEIK